MNPQEFWTKMPLPSVAANDPLFRNVTTNNWSGQAEALTYQRAIRALENYGMYELIPQLGQKLMQAIGPQCSSMTPLPANLRSSVNLASPRRMLTARLCSRCWNTPPACTV